jgi:hypothetical protein
MQTAWLTNKQLGSSKVSLLEAEHKRWIRLQVASNRYIHQEYMSGVNNQRSKSLN